jgi:signal transduction histidine kinase
MDDLFELSRLESGALTLQLDKVALEDILSDALEGKREQAEQANVTLVGCAEPTLPLTPLDPRQIQRVIDNLLQNALRHTPAGGAIMLHAATVCERGLPTGVMVQVIDTGEGIAAHDLPHIFERTYRGEASRRRSTGSTGAMGRAYANAGLGLAIAQRIVAAHGGSICAISPLDPEAAALLQRQGIVPTITAGAVLRFVLPANNVVH